MISNSKYRADIDGLRAIAVLSVLFFHAFPTAMRGGFIGVDVFFVISGYLISGILYNDLERGTFSLSHFYERRIKRIFPALLLTLAASLALGWFILLGDEYKQLGKHITGSAGFASNFVFWKESGYFDNASETKPLLHLWSLGIEEQFYIVWPVVLWLTFRFRIHPLIPAFLLLSLSFLLNVKGVRHDPAGTFYSPVTRFWELVAGGILAWIHRKRAAHPNAPSLFPANLAHLLSFVGLLMLLIGFFTIHRTFRFPGGWAVIPVLGAALLIGAGPQAYPNKYILGNRYIRWIGLISYPLYLWHWPLLTFARIVQGGTPSAGVRIGALVLAVVLAWITYRWIETPIRKGSTFPKTKVAVLLAGLLTMGTLGYLVYRRHGFPMRSTVAQLLEDERQVKSLAEDDLASHKQCMNTYQLSGPIRFCNLSGSGKPHIALIGDSHARSLYYGLAEQLQDRGEGLLNIGGRLFLGAAVHPPNNDFEIKVYQGGIQATKFVAQEPSIDTVIMASMGLTYLLDHPDVVFRLLDRPEITDRKTAWELALRQTLDAFVYTKKKVIFVVDNPEIDFDPRSCFPNRPLQFLRSEKKICGIKTKDYLDKNKEYRALVFSVLKAYPMVTVFDAPAYLCDETWCWIRRDGDILYRDHDHLSIAGSRLLAKGLISILDGGFSRILEPSPDKATSAFEPPPPTPPAQRLPLHPVSEEKITFPLPLDLWKNALLSDALVSAVSVGSSSTTFKVRIAPKSSHGFSIQAAWKAKSTLEEGDRRYRSVVAAFRLANRLQLPNVPPAWPHQIQAWLLPLVVRNQDVLAKVLPTGVDDRLYGSIVPWLPNFQPIPLENPDWKRVWSGWLDGSIGIPPDQKILAKEISNLIVFDYITANYDRFSGNNVGIDSQTGMLIFLDNDTGFLNPQNLNGWGWATLEKAQRFSKALFDQLQSLNKEELSAVFGEELPGNPLLHPTVVNDVWDRIVHIRTHIAEKQQRDPKTLSLDEDKRS